MVKLGGDGGWVEKRGEHKTGVWHSVSLFLDLCVGYMSILTLWIFTDLHTYDMCIFLNLYFSKHLYKIEDKKKTGDY